MIKYWTHLGELHLVHALACVPVEEGLPSEHGGELLGDPLEDLLDGRRVADKGGGHGKAPGRDVADGSLDIVGDPLDEVTAVLVLDVEHLLVDLTNEEVEKEKKERILWIWFLVTSFMDMRPRNTAATVR